MQQNANHRQESTIPSSDVTEQESLQSQTSSQASVQSTSSQSQPDRHKAMGKKNAAARSNHPFPVWGYATLFVIFDAVAVIIVQFGVHEAGAQTNPWGLISKMWTQFNFIFVLNLLIYGLAYLIVLMLTNRFWISSAALLAFAILLAVLEHFKVEIRNEAIVPADLGFLGSNTGNLLTFAPPDAALIITGAVVLFALFVAVFIVLNHRDSRRGRIMTTKNARLAVTVRVLGVLIPGLMLGAFTAQVGTVGSWANNMAIGMGDMSSMWDSVYDSQRNGAVLSFLRQLNPKIMDRPSNYSKATMDAVAKRYASEAKSINQSRTANLTDSTVIYVLSESFSDPSRVPGLKLNKDAIPNIQEIKKQTTSGLMLSSGYGGGTANLEYMQLTGLSMANFDASLTSPYQQLVPNAKWVPSINQLWGNSANSVAFHPYYSSMYSRSRDYQRFGFSHFYSLNQPDVIKHQDKIDQAPYVSDQSSYRNVLDRVSSHQGNQFIQLITMQNHMPFHDWYENNDFTAQSSDSANPLGSSETQAIQTYAKGASLTDTATKEFLNKLDSYDKPITVVFYGDHLPGIYSTAGADTNNSLALHLTDYFIWSNKASQSATTKNTDATYSSPNFFVAQTAEHMNAKVSPYIAFLTEMHSKIAAMEPPVVNQIQGWNRIPDGQPNYLNDQGKPIAEADFDAQTKQLMADYQLIQYDMTAGNGYLQHTDFLQLPR